MANNSNRKSTEILFKSVLFLLYAVSFSAFVWFLIKGWPYYKLPLVDRPFHPLHNQFKPGGVIGHGLGILGTTMMVLMLGYSIRKRTSLLNRFGSQIHWLNIHIFLGIAGSLFVVLHTSFKFNGIVAVSFWSMVAVVLSGFIGRYLYVKIPKNISAEKNKLKQLDHMLGELFKLNNLPIDVQMELVSNARFRYFGLVGVLAQLMFHDFVFPFVFFVRLTRVKKKFNLSSKNYAVLKENLLLRQQYQNRISFLAQVETLFHYWHVIHRPFTFLLFIILAIHISVAVLFGYTWVL